MSRVKAKNFGYESKKKQEEPKVNKKSIYIGLAALGLLLIAVVALICVEKGMENKFIVKNKSSHNITKMSYWYEDAEGQISDTLDLGAVKAKAKLKKSTESQKLSELMGEAWLCVHIEFEDGGKVLVETGQFLYDFKGKISVVFEDLEDGEVMVRLKAGEGLFNSTAVTGCDDVYYINPKDGYIE